MVINIYDKPFTLSPCPFCGTEEELYYDEDCECVACGHCTTLGPSIKLEESVPENNIVEEVVKRWNHRAG